MIDEHFQIGEVAERVDLSLRTIRYYEDIGLIGPSGRSDGGFRLSSDADVERLRLVKALKPVGMSLETMGEPLEAVDGVVNSGDGDRSGSEARLEAVAAATLDRCDELEEPLTGARAALERLATLAVMALIGL